jgi:hypothetical protein
VGVANGISTERHQHRSTARPWRSARRGESQAVGSHRAAEAVQPAHRQGDRGTQRRTNEQAADGRPMMDHRARTRLRAAAFRARLVYPGPVGELIAPAAGPGTRPR